MVALQQWVESGKHEGALLRSATLAVAEDWLQQRGGEVSKPQRWFIEKGVELRERERKQKQRLRRSVVGGLVCGLFLSSSLAGFAGLQWQEARTLAIKSQNSELVSGSYFAEKLFASNNELEALLEIVKTAKKLKFSAGISKDTIQRVVETLTKVVGRVRERNRLQTDASYAFEFSNAFQEEINTQEKDNIVIINNNYDSIISFSPDGKTIAAVNNGRKIKLWGTDGRYLETIETHTSIVTDIHFTPDSKTLVSASNDGIIQFWKKVDKGMHLSKTIKIDAGDTGTEKRLTFSPNGENIVSYDNSIIKLWNLNGKLIQTCNRQQLTDKISNWRQAIAYDTTKELQKNIYIWSIPSQTKSIFPRLYNAEKEAHYIIHWNTKPDNLVSFSANSKQIAVGNDDATITLRNLDGTNFRILKGHLGKLQSVIFSPDSKIISSADDEGKIKI
ncbi:hypothetical protein IQ247_04440 [Plectonema cf. radiosum LEGE 06105]|uniref:WD40 repeat-containing protein n=1 Tax=Plectonema cf. radiosum LEGE 06105 TaxID=945769 RepID=A0A8J7F9E1_9CYAN|nr:hypothetical protein [Plectonema radiosum]MBE9211973.1 hypothetical protein [Plectonema cf. radiosum LEGE 06105]